MIRRFEGRPRRERLLTRQARSRRIASLACSLTILGAVGTASATAAPTPARFLVGAAVQSTNPPLPVYSGGFGLSPPIQRVHDPLTVRAFYVSNGSHAVAIAVVDAQGYFAAYQDGLDLGITGERELASTRISALGGPKVEPSDIIVQATHGHAAPTLEGIWGPTPKPYLQFVHDQVVRALVDAARNARPALLQSATIDASRLDTSTLDTDSYPGWSNDGELHVLRAVDPASGATLATLANVSVHGAQVRGDYEKFFSSDYFGMSDARLEAELGGTAVVGPATLGREESPVEVTDVPTADWFSGVVSNFITRALRSARFVTDSTIASSQQFITVQGTNLALLALNSANHLSDQQKQQFASATGLYPIDRADVPPYQSGNVLGTYVTALRIGPLAYVSMPGEPFPEVGHAIRIHAPGVQTVTLLSKGQDDFGYFYPSWVYPFVFAYGDDHHIFNVAPQAGDTFIEAQLTNIAALGFQTTSYVDPAPLQTELTRTLFPGLEALASPIEGDAGSDGYFRPVLEAIYSPPTASQEPAAGKVHWDFADGTTADTGYLLTGQNYGHENLQEREVYAPARFVHAFRPGAYAVRLSASDPEGRSATWTLPVRAYPRLCPSITVGGSRRRPVFTGASSGGDGSVLAWRWRFSDGTSDDGQRVEHPFGPSGGSATLRATDGTGTVASVQVASSPGSRADACAATPSSGRTGHRAVRHHRRHRHKHKRRHKRKRRHRRHNRRRDVP